MTGVATGTAPTFRQLTVPASVLLLVGAAAWVGVVSVSRDMGEMPGTMGLGFGAFVAVWALMMTAMMLPTVAPFTALYTRTLTDHRARRIAELACGYLLVWTLAAVPAFVLAWVAGELVGSHAGAATVVAVVIFAACGIYQLTPLKDRCLAHCRSPLALLLHYGSYRGRSRDLRVGLHHGGYCLGCCWGLMVILIAVGVMNLVAMVGLAALVLVEKTWRWGVVAGRIAGVALLALAVAAIWLPWLAPGLHGTAPMMMS